MKINSIELYNFGSYEGETIFETPSSDGKNIILVGGKNGAGKTTLFTAMRLCLYGYMSMGYKNYNSFYTRAITKLINNSAKMTRPAKAYVKMKIDMSNGRGVDEFVLSRKWELSDTLSEIFAVEKNGVLLSHDETADFEKFLLSLIPPELFNLYFFDGERIADFFLEEGSNTRIKDAFLTLCGYDTFDIMRKNFKRVGAAGSKATPELDEYIAAKDNKADAENTLNDLKARLKVCIDEIDSCEAELAALEKDYYQKGGITLEEWNNKIFILKDEEKKRENWNAILKKWANDIIPFIMIRNQIIALKAQINNEANGLKYRNFCEIIESDAISSLLGDKGDAIKKVAFSQFGMTEQSILDLSLEQSALLLAQINQILEFEVDKVTKCKKAIKRSISVSGKIREELDNSNISSVQEYMQKRAQLFEQKSLLLVQRVEHEKQIAEQTEIVQIAEVSFNKIQSSLMEEFKKASVTDISARAIIMLDKLQEVLYKKQIEKVEEHFRAEIKTLMRKIKFIDDIHIDNNFNVHIFRKDSIEIGKIIEVLSANTEEKVVAMFGDKAIEELKNISGAESIDGVISYLKVCGENEILLPMEIDKSSLSNGEKQIFIMALYHSLVLLCKHEIPFVIDTPFARIDTEHRRNISKHFFSKLNGQVFILSTNEEIDSEHVQIIKENIAATYMLENTDNKKTVVVKNSYFEV